MARKSTNNTNYVDSEAVNSIGYEPNYEAFIKIIQIELIQTCAVCRYFTQGNVKKITTVARRADSGVKVRRMVENADKKLAILSCPRIAVLAGEAIANLYRTT